MAAAECQSRFGQSVKGLLSDKVGSCSGDVMALTRQVLKGSRSQEGECFWSESPESWSRCGAEPEPAARFCRLYSQVRGRFIPTQQSEEGSPGQLLGQAARNMVLQEDAILHSEDSLRKMSIITTHLQYQQEAIQKNVEHSRNLQDQLKHLLK
ncbi:BLOC-1-related complex subunit 7 isoform X1 [Salarias fasciatus]|uniref:BLOC-1-related complex subunit 7 n=1 Tax=Salarias fasciatus TaxID=181472 RepID=A0A672GTJ7_SALFA|nr:BLOC-1-related complex subunit 7 isoform X1 [Salarias fasciatus]